MGPWRLSCCVYTFFWRQVEPICTWQTGGLRHTRAQSDDVLHCSGVRHSPEAVSILWVASAAQSTRWWRHGRWWWWCACCWSRNYGNRHSLDLVNCSGVQLAKCRTEEFEDHKCTSRRKETLAEQANQKCTCRNGSFIPGRPRAQVYDVMTSWMTRRPWVTGSGEGWDLTWV